MTETKGEDTLGDQTDKAPSLRDRAYLHIRELIVTGALAPGQHLVEEALGRQLGMSRNPVREAIKLLERDGFVVLNPFRGAVVDRIGRTQATEVFELREVLESHAARKAAQNATPEDVERLKAILDAGEEALEASALSALTSLNTDFHVALHKMARNGELYRTLGSLRLKVEWMFSGYAVVRGEQSWSEHKRIFEAIVARDADLASARIRDHIAGSRYAYLALLEDEQQSAS